MSKVSIKICGLSAEETVLAAVNAGADFIGFVYYPKSPRHVSIEKAANLKKLLPPTVRSVMVLVNPDDNLLIKIATQVQPDYIQLHGDETVERLQEISKKINSMPSLTSELMSVEIQNDKDWIASATPRNDKRIGIIKAISVKTADDIKYAEKFAEVADYLLFDAKPTDKNMLRGGNGISFNWELLVNKSMDSRFRGNDKDNWFLSGGLNASNVKDAIKKTGAKFIDVSSGVESSAGVKDIKMIEEFVKAVNNTWIL